MEISANAPCILFLTQGDPRNDRGFPGAARALVEALDRAGVVHARANVRGLTDPFRVDPPQWLRTLRKFDRFFLEGHFRVSSLAFARNSNRARRIAHANVGYNACFMFGTHFAPPFDMPTYCSFDVTVAQVVEAGAWVYRRLTRSEIRSLRARQQRIFEQCAAIFPWSEYGAHSVEHDYGIPREKIVVLGAGANLSEEPLPHGPYDARNILFVGADFERKGGPLIVEAFSRVRERFPDATLTILGCTPEVTAPGVEIIGKVDKHAPGGMRRLLGYYSRASVFCMMSDFEPLGIVVLEAGLCGVPAVCPRRFAFPEMIADHETGRLVDRYDAGELANVLVDLLADPERLQIMGARAQEHVQQKWTWDHAASKVIQRIQSDLSTETT